MRVAALFDVHGMPWALEAVLAEVDAKDWDRGRLAADDLECLASLPLTASLEGVVYCHATPHDDMPLTTEPTPDALLEQRFPAGTTVIGHTHHQFDRRTGDVRVVNAGSVGMPFEGDVAAFWLLVDDGEPALRRTQSDVERAAAELRASGWPQAERFIAENLLAGPSRAEAVEFFEAQNG